EAGRRDASPARERLRVRDDPDVVRRDPGVDAALEQLLHAADVVRIDIGFRRERDLGWLLVRPLAEPHPRPPGDHVRPAALAAPPTASPRRWRLAEMPAALSRFRAATASSTVSPATKRAAKRRARPFPRTNLKTRGCSLSQRRPARSTVGRARAVRSRTGFPG